jgi:hypothetical protein
MSKLFWRDLARLKVPTPAGSAWTPALDFLTVNRIYRIRVADGEKWKPAGAATECTADGVNAEARDSSLVCAEASYGALIAKIGGSTADKTGIVFGVGRHCIRQVTDPTKLGPLYLGMNDSLERMSTVEGQLEVVIDFAL